MDRKLGIGIRCLVLAALVAGCAHVHVYKIGSNGEAVGPDGLRYYMPRPYVLVHEAFIVGAKTCVLAGELTPDGQHVLLRDVPASLDPDLRELLTAIAPTGELLSSQVVALPDSAPEAQPGAQGRVEGEPAAGGGRDASKDAGGGGAGSGGTTQPGGKPEGSTPSDKPGDTTPPAGKSTLKATNDNTAFAVTPLKRYVDIVWLPDFDEQYVVETSSNFGNADISLQYGQGWSLQALDAKVDNSAILGPLVKLYEQATQLAGEVARTELGFPLTIGGAQGRREPTAETFTGGTPVAVKVTLVSIAAPGLYPVLKPAELTQAQALVLAQNDVVRRRILVPIPPLTNVAFNVARTVLLEAARADSDAAMRLYQYVETGPSKPVTSSSSTPSAAPTGALGLQQSIAQKLKDGGLTGWSIVVDEKNAQAKTYTAKATRPGAGTSDDDKVRSIITETIEAAGGTIDAADIVIKPKS